MSNHLLLSKELRKELVPKLSVFRFCTLRSKPHFILNHLLPKDDFVSDFASEFVFDDTVANNITFWEGDWKEDESLHERIKLALKKSDLYETIKSLPNGLDTVIGDRGALLSGGQKQRLFIAREIFRSPELLIFDEATSALDYNSENSISEAINNMRGSVTIIIIAHRLKTIKSADIIYVLKDGKIEEQGSYQELLKNDGGYISKMASSAV